MASDAADSGMRAKAEGCLFGAAVGDALGAPVEAMLADQIERRFPEGLADYVSVGKQREILAGTRREPRGVGVYTDDTEMAIGLAKALIQSDGDADPLAIARMHVQEFNLDRGYGKSAEKILMRLYEEDLLGQADASARAHDPSQAVVDLARGSRSARPNDSGSWSNGGPMRIHPLGVAAAMLPSWEKETSSSSGRQGTHAENILRWATLSALLCTHTHPDALDAAFIQPMAVAKMMRIRDAQEFISGDTERVDDGHEPSPGSYKQRPGVASGFRPLLQELIDLSRSKAMHEKLVELDTLIFEAQWSEFDIVNGPEETVNGEFVSGLRPLMDGVLAVEAVSTALCALAFHAHEPAKGIMAAVAYGGDTDTIASMAGALLGALHGSPERWMRPAWIRDFEAGTAERNVGMNSYNLRSACQDVSSDGAQGTRTVNNKDLESLAKGLVQVGPRLRVSKWDLLARLDTLSCKNQERGGVDAGTDGQSNVIAQLHAGAHADYVGRGIRQDGVGIKETKEDDQD